MANIGTPVTTASVTSAATIMTLSTLGFASISFQFTSVGSGNTVSFEGSNDNTNWVACFAERREAVNGVASAVAVATTMAFLMPTTFVWHRFRVSTYGSGTVTMVTALRTTPPADTIVALRAGTANVGVVTAAVASPTVATSRSGTITLGGTAQNAAAALATRKGLVLQNSPAAAEVLNYSFAGAASATTPSLAVGATLVLDAETCPTTALSVLGATTGHAFFCEEFS